DLRAAARRPEGGWRDRGRAPREPSRRLAAPARVEGGGARDRAAQRHAADLPARSGRGRGAPRPHRRLLERGPPPPQGVGRGREEDGMSTQETTIEAVRRSVTVDCSVEDAFTTFTERIHEWWPLGTHSIDHYETGSGAETVVFQGGAGGQVYERTKNGEELKWADVGAYDPPHRFVLA